MLDTITTTEQEIEALEDQFEAEAAPDIDLAGFASLRTRPPIPALHQSRRARRCARCGAHLSRYNKADTCMPCQQTELERELRREQELLRAVGAQVERFLANNRRFMRVHVDGYSPREVKAALDVILLLRDNRFRDATFDYATSCRQGTVTLRRRTPWEQRQVLGVMASHHLKNAAERDAFVALHMASGRWTVEDVARAVRLAPATVRGIARRQPVPEDV